MRRPLNGNGAPFVISGNGDVTVFDTEDFDPKYSYAVTLFAYFPIGIGNISNLVVVDDDPPDGRRIAGYVASSYSLLQALGKGAAKLTDRLILRGKQKLIFQTASYGTDIWVYGYFERAGVQDLKEEYRPLQPTDMLQEPFNAPMFTLGTTAGGGNAGPVVIHQLDKQEERVDMLSLTIFAALGGAAGGGGQALVSIPGLPTPMAVRATPDTDGAFPIILMEDIPIRALGSSPADSQITLEAIADADETMAVTVYGRFTRG